MFKNIELASCNYGQQQTLRLTVTDSPRDYYLVLTRDMTRPAVANALRQLANDLDPGPSPQAREELESLFENLAYQGTETVTAESDVFAFFFSTLFRDADAHQLRRLVETARTYSATPLLKRRQAGVFEKQLTEYQEEVCQQQKN